MILRLVGFLHIAAHDLLWKTLLQGQAMVDEKEDGEGEDGKDVV